MSFYEEHMLPHVINCACGMKTVAKQREKIVPQARGQVLEVGMGSGLNLPFYNNDTVDFVWGLEPSSGMRRKAQANIDAASVAVRWLDLPGEHIPLEDNSVDTVLLTYTLCTIPDWFGALKQMQRVLKPGGKLLFCEHGAAPDENTRRWQRRIGPLWKKIGGGCHLDRDIPLLLQESGLAIEKMETGYIKGPKFTAYNYWGVAA